VAVSGDAGRDRSVEALAVALLCAVVVVLAISFLGG
jgi:hypothetical protein